MLSDCHVHLDTYEKAQLDQVIEKANARGVEIIVAVSMNAESSGNILGISELYDCVLPAVGIHPWNALSFNAESYQRIKELALSKRVVAIGEIGLDFARSPETKAVQRQAFEEQVRLAKEIGLPINMHCRQAHQEAMAILKELQLQAAGIVHGFNGDEAMLSDWLELGFYISLGMSATTAGEDLKRAIQSIPIDRLLLETDSSAGRTLREKVEPASVWLIAEKVAEMRGMSGEALANATTLNLRHLLKAGT